MSRPDENYPDSTNIGNFRRMHLRPVLRTGSFRAGFFGDRRLGDGWAFDASPEHMHKPAWSAELLYAMITTTLASIKALPGPKEW